MEWALTVGSVRGVKIKIHVTFFLTLLWAAYNWGVTLRRGASGAVFGLILIVLLFACIVLHELAHSAVAMLFGVHVHEIDLLPIGGIARMDSVPAKPHQEFLMALSGPLINLILALPLGGLTLWLIQVRAVRSLGHLFYLMSRPSWQSLILNLFVSNVALALFNLLPALPMDGGRLLRSTLAWGIGKRRATLWASRFGQILATLLAIMGIVMGNVGLVFIAVLILVAARQEAQFADCEAMLGDIRVRQALITPCPTLSRTDTLQVVLDSAMRGHAAPFAVVEAQELVGWLTQQDIQSALAIYDTNAQIGDVMGKQFAFLPPGATLLQARQELAMRGLQALPVIEGKQLLGMVTTAQIQDIYVLLSAKQRRERT
jgi:Zn-dependent protease/CBS domain-containing protein